MEVPTKNVMLTSVALPEKVWYNEKNANIKKIRTKKSRKESLKQKEQGEEQRFICREKHRENNCKKYRRGKAYHERIRSDLGEFLTNAREIRCGMYL